MSEWSWEIENEQFLSNTVERCREKNIILPKFSELKHPHTIPNNIQEKLSEIDLQDLHPLNLFRINWSNDNETGGIGEINYLEIPREITGIKARVIGLVGKYFPTGGP